MAPFLKDGGVAQSVRASNSNCKGGISMPTLGITRCCVLGKNTLKLISKLAAVQLNG